MQLLVANCWRHFLSTGKIINLVFIGCLYFLASPLVRHQSSMFSWTPHYRWITLQKKGFFTCQRNPLDWLQQTSDQCGGHFIGYGQQFAVLNNATVIPNRELFYIPCSDSLSIKYEFEAHNIDNLNTLMKNVIPVDQAKRVFQEASSYRTKAKHERSTFVVARNGARRNLWYTMAEWYNVFLVSKMLNISVENVDILIYDNVPEEGIFDHVWRSLFRTIEYAKTVKDVRFIENMVWSVQNDMSPLQFSCMSTPPPYLDDFKDLMLRKYKINESDTINCKHLRILFLLQKDSQGPNLLRDTTLDRTIMNSDELAYTVKQRFAFARVGRAYIEDLSFEEQMKTVSGTDILISIHGTALTHILFLPKHAGVLEIFPCCLEQFLVSYHYKNLARYRQLRYVSWTNYNPNNEYSQFNTYVPPLILEAKVQRLYDLIC